MHNSRQAHRRTRLVAIFGIVMLLASVLPMSPVMAQDPPEDIAPALQAVSISCNPEGSDSVLATVAVGNPNPDVSVAVRLFANTDNGPVELADAIDVSVPLNDLSVTVGVQVPASAASVSSTVIAKAFVSGNDAITPAWSDAAGLPIHAANGGSLCGSAPLSTESETSTATASATATDTPTQTATATLTPTQTATASATTSPTATGTATQTATATATTTVTPTVTPTATATSSPAPVTMYATVVNTQGANLRCRATPVDGTELGQFAAGSSVELRGDAVNGWYPVVCPNGQDGHSSGEYLQVDASTPPSDGDESDEGDGGEASGVAVVQNTGSDGLRCRTSPVNGSIINVYPDGTQLNMRGAVENGWAPVTCSGQDGWISTQYARVESGGSTTDPDPGEGDDSGSGTGEYGTVVNTGIGLRCRTAPVSGSTITVVPDGTKLETRGDASNNWYPVICNGQSGFVFGDYFTLGDGGSSTPPVDGSSDTAMVTGTGGGGLRCRTAPVDGGVITVFPEGTLVNVRGSIQNGWAPVECAGQNGWSSAAYLNFDISGGGTGELWMDVDLGSQYMRVYRGNTVIAQTYVSTGRPGFDTPTGSYYINWKLPSQTMSGVLGGEYYYVPNVPWVMYFTDRGHAIHGAYWHNNFGQVMSHGCINLPVGFAEWLYSVTPYGALVRIHW